MKSSCLWLTFFNQDSPDRNTEKAMEYTQKHRERVQIEREARRNRMNIDRKRMKEDEYRQKHRERVQLEREARRNRMNIDRKRMNAYRNT